MAKKLFGGKLVHFAGRTETAEEIFGAENLSPSEMTKRLWAFVKKHGLLRKA